MRKRIALLLVFLLLIPLAGCKNEKDILFYYPRKEIIYGQADGVITAESRDISDREADLSYLLMLYLEGPIDQGLTSHFPQETAVTHLEIRDNCLCITLSEHFSRLEGLEYTIACTCIALTCFDLRDVDAVEITSENRTITLNRDSVALADTAATVPG